MDKKIIKTKDFVLRPLNMGDAESVAKHANHPIISRNTLVVPYPYKEKDAVLWLRRMINMRRRKKPASMVFGIEIENEIVGSFGIHKIVAGHKAEIGYWIGKKYWGQGIMSSVIKETVNYCFRELKLKRISAKVFPFNKASMRVLEKNNFKFEGILKKEEKKGDKFLDTYVYAKIRK